jgi:hypothetical protein
VNNIDYHFILQGITCVYVDVPDCEVIICSLRNPRRTLLPQEKSEMYKRDCLPSGEDLITFLCQHDFDVKPEMVRLPLSLPNFSDFIYTLFLHCYLSFVLLSGSVVRGEL